MITAIGQRPSTLAVIYFTVKLGPAHYLTRSHQQRCARIRRGNGIQLFIDMLALYHTHAIYLYRYIYADIHTDTICITCRIAPSKDAQRTDCIYS